MELPMKPQKAMTEGIPEDLDLLIFGPPKIGKTVLGASFPKSLLIECEPKGARYVNGLVMEVNGLAELRDTWKLLEKKLETDPGYCETIVLDTLDRVAQWVEKDICKEMGLKNILETKKGEKHGSQWGAYVDGILLQLEGWKMFGKRVVFLAHTKKAETDADGNIVSPKSINLYGQAASRVLSLVENVGYFHARKGEGKSIERVLSFAPGVSVDCGARHPSLADQTIIIDKDDPYKSFGDLFKVPKSNGAPKKLPAKSKAKEAVKA